MDAAPKKQKTLLLVEDDAEVRRAAALVLSSLGHRVLECEGLEVGFHLVLPDGTGVEFCRKVRAHKNLSTTPVIIVQISGAAIGSASREMSTALSTHSSVP